MARDNRNSWMSLGPLGSPAIFVGWLEKGKRAEAALGNWLYEGEEKHLGYTRVP
jgi:hypothetical protein